jgi:DNA-binding NarL/FixJ family response regulator
VVSSHRGSFETPAGRRRVRNTAARELVKALRAVLRGERYLGPKAAAVVPTPEQRKRPGDLTDREREVLQLLAEGKASKEIADVLCMSTRTAEAYRVQIMDKLSIRTVAGLTKYAVLHGLTVIQ